MTGVQTCALPIFFIAKRTRSIQNAYLNRTATVENLKDALLNAVDPEQRISISAELEEAQRKLKNIRIAYEKIPVKTDDLIQFPETNSELVIAEIKNFW